YGQVPAIRDGAAAAAVLDFPAMSSGTIAVRQWVYLPVPLVRFDTVLTVRGVQSQYVTVAGDFSGRWVATEHDPTAATVTDHHTTVTAVLDKWTCVELDYSFAPPTIHVYVDDALILDERAADPAPVYDKAWV